MCDQSYIWKYFRSYKCSAQCLLCNKAFVYSGGTTVYNNGSTTVVLWDFFRFVLLVNCENNEDWDPMIVPCYISTPMRTELYLLDTAVLIKLQSVLVKRVPEQEIAWSSEWPQLWTPIPLLKQERRHDSVPKQPTLSSQIGPEPDPYL